MKKININRSFILIIILNFLSIALALASVIPEGDEELLTRTKTSAIFDKKIQDVEEDLTVGNGWYDARLITPGTQFFVKSQGGYQLHKQDTDLVELHLYQQLPAQAATQSPSHGLIKTDASSLAISVDTSIQTQTNRKKETKTTFVQYERTIQQAGKDFIVDPCILDANDVQVLTPKKRNPYANYDGGHLVDHKFSAQGSHVDAANYVPQHHYYNRWLKECIVDDADGYLEIPLFTSNPPMIKVKGKPRYDAIPVGILLVPLKQFRILDMYYFPNNQFNYRKCQVNLEIPSDGMAQRMIANFKIRREFHRLLLPAIIYDIKTRHVDLAQQLTHEANGTGVVGELVDGMSLLSLDDEEAALSTLASDVIHQTDVKISNILGLPQTTIAAMNRGQRNQGALSQAFNALGQFLVDYAMKNALKSELISTHSRIMFANIITDFIDCRYSDDVSDQAFNRVDNAYKDVYPATLKELWKFRKHMNLRDLLYFANLYQTLASSFMHSADCEGYKVWEHMDYDENVLKFIKILEFLYNKSNQAPLNQSQMQNLVDLFSEAQGSLSYVVCNGYPREELVDQRVFLEKAKERVFEWESLSHANSGSYEKSPKTTTAFRGINGINIAFLGTFSSSEFLDQDDDSQDDTDAAQGDNKK
jgi:hypothetical protein